jgi:protein TonB
MKEIKTKSPGRGNDRGKRNVRKNGFLRFQLALILALLLVYGGLEASFEYLSPGFNTKAPEPIADLTEIPPENWVPEKKVIYTEVVPKSTRLGAEIKQVSDDTDIDRPEDEVICTDCADEPVDLSEIENYEDPNAEPETVVMAPGVLDELPVFPGCEKVDKSERFDCFNKMMNRHVRRVFRYPQADLDRGSQGKVYVNFRINEHGIVDQIQYQGRGTTESLDKEAYRIISKLPKMKPAKKGGKSVRVTYSIPIVFQSPQ